MLLPASSFAQNVEVETGGGMLGLGKLFGSDGQLFGNRGEGDDEFELDVETQDFGDAPLGSGIVILLAAGAGYAAFKRKEEQQ